MLLKSYSKPKNIGCTLCDYKTNRVFNLDRHMITKHTAPKCNPDAPKCNPNAPICNPIAPKCNPNAPICNLTSTTLTLRNQCDICEKIFSRYNILIKHKEKCKGKINSLKCQYCNTVFTLSQAKYRHQKICKERLPSTDLIIPQGQGNTIIGTNIGTNIGTIENQNNTQNISIVVYSSDTSEKFLKDSHIDNKAIARIINNESVLDTLNNYNRELFSLKENQCVRKTNMRSSDLQVHIGNNKWETRCDSEIFPKLMCSSANSFSELLTLKRLSKRYPELDTLLHYVGEEGYINTDNIIKEKETKDLFKDSVRSLTRIIYDITKEYNIEI